MWWLPPTQGVRKTARGLTARTRVVLIVGKAMDATSPPNHPDWPRSLSTAAALAQPWAGDAFRFGSFDYLQPDEIVSGIGSALHGARWNAAGSPPTLYASLSRPVASAECDATAAYYGLAHLTRSPLVAVTLQVSLQAVLDLSTPKKQRAAGLDLGAALAEDWRKAVALGQEAATQALGRAAREAGLEGLLVPSVQMPDGVNLVCFREKLRAGSTVGVWGAETLWKVEARQVRY